jgi:hypothetical protein
MVGNQIGDCAIIPKLAPIAILTAPGFQLGFAMPTKGVLFPYQSSVRANDRATEF